MITVFKNERKIVAEKLPKSDGKDKENLKVYDKYLKDNIEKLQEYEDSLLTEYEKNIKDTGEEYNKDDQIKDITGDYDDNDSDDDFDDFDLEATSFETLFDNSNGFSREYFNNNINKCIDYMNEDTIDLITDISIKYPNIVSQSSLVATLNEQLDELNDKYSGSQKWIRMSCLKSNLRKLEDCDITLTADDDQSTVFDVITGLEDLFTEYSINRTLNITNESMSTMAKSISDAF